MTYRAALIGCGSIGRAHAGAYGYHRSTQLVAVADTDDGRRREYAQAFGAPGAYADYREMLAKERPDIVSICTWPQVHVEMTLACADAGVKGILCEKPMALRLADVDRMISYCQAKGVKLVTGHELRFFPQHIQARQLIDAGEIGQVFWMRGARQGGDLVTNAIHTVDLMRYFMNDAPVLWAFGQVEARTGRTAYGHPTEDSAIGYLGFASGVRAFLETGAFTTLGNHHLLVYGAHGWLEVNPKDLHDMVGPHLRFQRKGSGQIEEVTIDNTDHNARSFVGVLDALVTWMDGGPESPTSARNARLSQEAVYAIVESARLGRVVSLPLTATDEFPNELLVRARAAPGR